MNLSIKIIGGFLVKSSSTKDQTFEGKISFDNSYQSKLDNLKSEQLNEMMGTNQVYYIKGSNYKSLFNRAFTKMQLYKSSESISYTPTEKTDTLFWDDYGINKDEAIKYELKKMQILY